MPKYDYYGSSDFVKHSQKLCRLFYPTISHYVVVDKNCSLRARDVPNLEYWFNSDKELYEIYLNPTKPPKYDSGLVGLKNVSFSDVNTNVVETIYFNLMSYQMMGVLESEKNKHPRFGHKAIYHSLKPQLAIGVGIVLSIIAQRGSSRNQDSRPYIILVKRFNNIRHNELDTAVVEGINCSDFTLSNEPCHEKNRWWINYAYEANLEDIVIRALSEERGINCQLLKDFKLIQLPEKYYLGYDAEWGQWNIFGTVTIDSTVEEIIRQSHYFSKDFFETNDFIAMPFDENTVCYNISQEKLDIRNPLSQKETLEHRGIWNTGWASIEFAFMDNNKSIRYNIHNSLSPRNVSVSSPRCSIRKSLNNLSEIIGKHKNIMNVSVTATAIVATILFFTIPIPDIFGFISLLISLALIRLRYINPNNILHVPMKDASLNTDLEQFSGITILDGMIGNNSVDNRKIYLTFEKQKLLSDNNASEINNSDKNYYLKVNRHCHVFPNKEKNWIPNCCGKDVVEIPEWIVSIDTDDDGVVRTKDASVRVVLALVSEDNKIIFQKTAGENLKHVVDVTINLLDLCSEPKYDELINISKLSMIKTIDDILNKLERLIEESNLNVQYKYLLKYVSDTDKIGEENYAIVGTIYLSTHVTEDMYDKLSSCYIVRQMDRDMPHSEFSLKFDNVNRCVLDLAITEYLGYKLSEYGR